MSDLRKKAHEYLKGKPETPTPKRDNTTEAYFSADTPLEGDRDSEVQSFSSRAESTTGTESTESIKSIQNDEASSNDNKAASPPAQQEESSYKDVFDKDSASEDEKQDKVMVRRASDVLLHADLRDMSVLSTMMCEMNEKGVSEEEKLGRLLEKQKSREDEREVKKKGDGRYLGTM